MYVCRACARRWTGPIIQRAQTVGRARPAIRPVSGLSREQELRSLSTRTYATAVPTTEVDDLQEEDDSTHGKKSVSIIDSSKFDAAARRQLKFFKDPFTIGNHVADRLAKKKYEEALQFTRMASKSQQVVVSWNHLIGYLMKQEKITAAMKLFNEMKKRGQLPNAQTYTIIFRGCAASPHSHMAVYQATRLYYSMLDSDRLKPNTVHMNAVLQVCARAKDIESLFSVAKTANNRQRSPDNLTYTTILNGLRFSTAQPHHRSLRETTGKKGARDDEEEEDVHVDKEKVSVSVNRARAVWGEVVDSWQHGRIMLDEELVCAMGRVLLMGGYQDNDDILSLVEQTTGIPRLDRQPVLPVAKANSQVDNSDAKTPITPETAVAETGVLPPVSVGEGQNKGIFSPLPQGVIGSKMQVEIGVDGAEAAVVAPRRIAYATPGRNMLSVTLTSLGATRKTSLASRYWEIFTTGNQQHHGYDVVPDSENWYRLLKALRRGHNSGKTAELMQAMPQDLMNERTFRLAMATCAADNLNANVFASAGKILDMMSKTLRVPDPHTLRLYLQTAVTNNRRFRDQQEEEVTAARTDRAARGPRAGGGAWGRPGQGAANKEAAKFAFGRQIVRALTRLWDPLRISFNAARFAKDGEANKLGGRSSASLLPVPPAPSASTGSGADEKRPQAYNAQRELIALARQMVSAADMVVTEGMADEATLKDVRTSRNLLNRQITRFYESRDDMEPNLKWKTERGKPGMQRSESRERKSW